MPGAVAVLPEQREGEGGLWVVGGMGRWNRVWEWQLCAPGPPLPTQLLFVQLTKEVVLLPTEPEPWPASQTCEEEAQG